MDRTEDNIISEEEEAANDGDRDRNLLDRDCNKELCAVLDEESIDEDLLGFSSKASSNPNSPFQGHKFTRNMFDTRMNPFSSFFY